MKKLHNCKKMQRIVVIRTDRIGEVLLSTPVIEALHKRFKDATIDFVTSPYSVDIVSDRVGIDKVILFDTFSKRLPVWSAISLASKLRSECYDMAVILNPHKILHLGCFLAGIPIRVGFSKKWPFLLTHRTDDNRDEARKHEVEYNLELLRIIDIYADKISPLMPVLSKSSSEVGSILNKAGIKDKNKIVAIHPGSSNAKKQWDIKNFSKVAKALVETGNIDVVVIGDKSEKHLSEYVVLGAGKNTYDLAGLFTIKQLAAFMQRADILITNDNGPMHIAAAVGTKVVAIFNKDVSGSNPSRWAPYGDGHRVFYKDFNDIKPEEITESVKAILK